MEFLVVAVEGEELFVPAPFNDAAFVHNDNLVGVLDGREAVGDGYRGAVAHQSVEGVLHYALCNGWRSPEGLVSPHMRYPDGRVIYGSGVVMYPGKHGVPEPSVRIDAVRDALEDFEYLKMIEKIAAARPADPAAQEALTYAKNAAEKLVPCYEAEGDGLKAPWKTLLWELDWKVLLDYRKGLMDRLERLTAGEGR